MPVHLSGALDSKKAAEFDSANYDYSYPYGLDLSPKSTVHKKIVDRVLLYANQGATAISQRHGSWKEIDRTLTAYIELDDDEVELRDEDGRKPTSIVFPFSYAILETFLSYLTSAFYQEPIFRYEGVSPEDTVGAILLTKIIDMQCYKAKTLLNLHTMWRDSLAYGFGLVGTGWKRETTQIVRAPKAEFFGFQIPLPRKVRKELVTFEGNYLINVDPYKQILDPDVPVTDFQKSEYFGWVEQSNFMKMLREEKDGKNFFNAKYLRHLKNRRTAVFSQDSSGRNDKSSAPSARTDDSWVVDKIRLYMDIIPDELGIGNSSDPERYIVEVAADCIITRFEKLSLLHGNYPAAVCAPDFDGYATTPISRLEVLYGLQHTLDFMFNSHVANVRKAVNDTIIVDPEVINLPDFNRKHGKEGGIVRVRKPYWGMGKIKDSITQLAINDITRGHVVDASQIQDAMERIAGVDAATMGVLRKGGPERLTKGEFQGTRSGNITRLERVAKLIGLQAMQDIGTIFAHHTQQFMKEETWVNITGKWEEQLREAFSREAGKYNVVGDKMKVSPYDLLIDFDLKVRDGSIPGGNYSPVWENLFELVANHPELSQKFDLVKIFKHIARNNGEKNPEEYVIKVAPDQQVLQQAEAGNVVPMQAPAERVA
jgi:hypothetical protein